MYSCIKLFARYVALASMVLATGGWSYGTGNYNVVNVFTYMSVAQQADVKNWTGTLDVTTPIVNAIAAIPSVGGVLVFPPGRYKTATCNFAITNPTQIEGGGSSNYTATAGITQIECSSNTATLFTITASVAKFSNIALVDTAASRSAGSAIFTNGAVKTQRVDYDNILISGFYDSIDVGVGTAWIMNATQIYNSKHWGVRVRNTVDADYGDWTITNTNIFPAANAAAGIRYESSGGGKISKVKIVPESGAFVDGVSIDTTGQNSGQILIDSVGIEGGSGIPINVVRGWPYMKITGSYLRANGGGPAISLSSASNVVVANNILIGTGNYGIATPTSVSVSTFGLNNYDGFTYPAQHGRTDNSIDYTGFTYLVGDLPNPAQVPLGTRIFVTDATATTFASIAAGTGANKVPVFSNGTNWLIGG